MQQLPSGEREVMGHLCRLNDTCYQGASFRINQLWNPGSTITLDGCMSLHLSTTSCASCCRSVVAAKDLTLILQHTCRDGKAFLIVCYKTMSADRLVLANACRALTAGEQRYPSCRKS